MLKLLEKANVPGYTVTKHVTGRGPERVISEDFELIERYTLVGDNDIQYEFTVHDEQAYTRPFSGERILSRNAPEEKVC